MICFTKTRFANPEIDLDDLLGFIPQFFTGAILDPRGIKPMRIMPTAAAGVPSRALNSAPMAILNIPAIQPCRP